MTAASWRSSRSTRSARLAEFKKEVGEFTRYLKETPPSEGLSGVLYPGEIEHRREQDRRANGIEVEDATWFKLRDAGRRLRPDRPARLSSERRNDRSAAERRPADPLRQLHLEFELQADAVSGVGRAAVFVPHGQSQDRRAEGRRNTSAVNRWGVVPSLRHRGPDDPAIECDPRLPRAHDRAFRGRHRAAALAGARMAVVGGRPHHRRRQGAPLGAVPRDRTPRSSPSSARTPRRRLSFVDDTVRDRPFLLGDRCTIADIGCWGRMVFMAEGGFEIGRMAAPRSLGAAG